MAAASIGGSESADERAAVGQASRLLCCSCSPRPPARWRARTATRSPDDIFSQREGGGEKEREKGKEKRVKSLALFSEKKASNPKRRKTSAAFSNSAQKMPSALVTGGGAGIGAATAIRLAERGYSVTVRRGSELS